MLLEVVGLVAMVIILSAYAANSMGRLDVRAPLYQVLNLVGSLMFVVYLSVKHAWSSVVLNAVWASIALFILVRRALQPTGDKQKEAS